MPNWRRLVAVTVEMISLSTLLFFLIAWLRAAIKEVKETKHVPEAKGFGNSKFMFYNDIGHWFVLVDAIWSVIFCVFTKVILERAGRENMENFIQYNYYQFTIVGSFGVLLTTLADEYMVEGPFNTKSLLYAAYFISRMSFICLYAPANVKDDFYRQLASKLLGLVVLNFMKEEWWAGGTCVCLYIMAVTFQFKDYYSLRYRTGQENQVGETLNEPRTEDGQTNQVGGTLNGPRTGDGQTNQVGGTSNGSQVVIDMDRPMDETLANGSAEDGTLANGSAEDETLANGSAEDDDVYEDALEDFEEDVTQDQVEDARR